MGEIIIIGDVFSIAVLCSPILDQDGFTYTPINFYEQASHIREPQINFNDTPRSSNGLGATLKNT
jgi:hypothetical protein